MLEIAAMVPNTCVFVDVLLGGTECFISSFCTYYFNCFIGIVVASVNYSAGECEDIFNHFHSISNIFVTSVISGNFRNILLFQLIKLLNTS